MAACACRTASVAVPCRLPPCGLHGLLVHQHPAQTSGIRQKQSAKLSCLVAEPSTRGKWASHHGQLSGARGRGSLDRTTACSSVRNSDKVTFQGAVNVSVDLDVEPVPVSRYIAQSDRLFYIIFPDRNLSQKIAEDKWRVQLGGKQGISIPLLFDVKPVIDIEAVLEEGKGGNDSSLRFLATQCDLGRDLADALTAAEFDLAVEGVVYCLRERGSPPSLNVRLGTNVQLLKSKINAFGLLPASFIRMLGESIVSSILAVVVRNVDEELFLRDYLAFCREYQAALPKESRQ